MNFTERLLLDCLHQDPARLRTDRVAATTAAEWEALLDLGARQRVRPMVLRRLTQPDVRNAVPLSIRERLTASSLIIAKHNLELHAELGRLAAILSRAGIPVLVLKGMHVATALYGNSALREVGDMDIMVQRAQIAQATSLVLADGYAPARAFDIDVDLAVSQHVTPMFKRPHFQIELHWNLAAPRQPYHTDPTALWRRATEIRVLETNAHALSADDLLLHLCMHLSYQHGFEFGLRSLCDLTELLALRSDELQWENIWKEARHSRLLSGTRLSLELAQQLLGAPLPRNALNLSGPEPVAASVVVQTAGLHLLNARTSRPSLSPGHSRLYEAFGVRRKWRHLMTTVFRPLEEMRKMYPNVSPTGWTWPLVYGLRCRDLVRRHAWQMVRFAVRRELHLRAAVARQGVLRAFLAADHRPEESRSTYLKSER